MRTTLLLAVTALLSACTTDGANGENGKVRFSMVFNAQEVSDFSPPIALGSSLLIKLEEPSAVGSGGTAQPGFPELSLEVKAIGHKGTATVLPLGFAQYAIQMAAEGDYQLVAKNGTDTLDALSVKVAKPEKVRLSPKAYVVTSVRSGTTSCTKSATLDVADVLLHKNESVRFDLTAADKDNKAMLGLLGLTAHEASGVLELDTTWLAEGGAPNALIVRVKGTLTDKATINVKESTGLTLDVEVKTSNTDATGTCN